MADRHYSVRSQLQRNSEDVHKERSLYANQLAFLRVSEYLFKQLSIYLAVTLYALARHMMGDFNQHLTVLTGSVC